MMHYVISDVHAREILDSRGNPTVEAQVIVNVLLLLDCLWNLIFLLHEHR